VVKKFQGPEVTLLRHEVVGRIAQKHNKSNAQVLIRFNLERGICTIPKSVNPERLRENFNVLDFQLDSQDVQDLLNLDINLH